jgi:hypothetical protein
MGVNISIKDSRTKQDLPEWDCCRFSGDREVSGILYANPSTNLYEDMDFVITRPESVEDFRSALHANIQDNPERWDQMRDILARDAYLGLYFSW